MSEITFVLTSCGRFDLLEIALDSFLEHNTAPIAKYILIEDSGDRSVEKLLSKCPVPFQLVVNDPPLGQIASIDRAYSLVTTPYIFHCEDDWRFFRSGFVEESIELLEAFPHISMVLTRRAGQTETSDLIYQGELRHHQGIAYRCAPRLSSPHWLGYSFNPGLRRLADYERMGTFQRLGQEVDASIYFKRRRMTMAALEEPACETTGWKRHVFDPISERHWRGYLLEWYRSLVHKTESKLNRIRSADPR